MVLNLLVVLLLCSTLDCHQMSMINGNSFGHNGERVVFIFYFDWEVIAAGGLGV